MGTLAKRSHVPLQRHADPYLKTSGLGEPGYIKPVATVAVFILILGN
jgi:hypothetical protein